MAKGNENGSVSIKIDLNTYNSLKRICDEEGYTYGGFAVRAIMEKVELIRKGTAKKQVAKK